MVRSFYTFLEVKGSATADAFVRSLGLPDVSALLDFKLFAPFKEKPFTKVYRLQSPATGMLCYLKKTPFHQKNSFVKYVLRALVRHKMPHTEAYHVYATSQLLQRLNIAAMDVIAFGELRAFGVWPVSGFALCAAVPGEDFSILFQQSPPAERMALLGALGRQVAQLHGNGLFYNTRMHDYIVQPGFLEAAAAKAAPPAQPLTLIDLDFADSTWKTAALAVTYSIYLTLRTGIRFSATEIGHLFRSYRQAMRLQGRPVSRAFLTEVKQLLNKELRAHHADPERIRLYPQTPVPV
jgi:hypothetical protein